MKRIVAGVLLLSFLTASIGCSETSGGRADDTKIAQSQDGVTEAETDALKARMDVDDGLPNKDFGGRDYVILGEDQFESLYVIDEDTGDVLDSAIYERNAVVVDRFNVNIKAEVHNEGQLTTLLRNAVMAGDDAYQLFAGHAIYNGWVVESGVFLNWYDVDYIDFSKPWWSKSTVEDLTYNDIAFLAIGDFVLSAVTLTYAMYFNKQLVEDFGIPDIYTTVLGGEWTLDKLSEYTKNVYNDINNNQKKDIDDLYGFGLWARSPVNTFLWAFGEKVAVKKKDGSFDFSYFNEKVVSIYEKLYSLLWENEGAFSNSRLDSQPEFRTMFTSNLLMFYTDYFEFASTELRSFETDYGIIPYPKWDTKQESYYTMVDGGHDTMGVPMSVTDTEFVGIVTEALCAESYKRAIPAYYDVALKVKGTRDETSIKILDLLFENRVFDFGYIYGQFDSPAFWVQYLMEQQSTDIASYYEKNHKVFEKRMEIVLEYFEKYRDG